MMIQLVFENQVVMKLPRSLKDPEFFLLNYSNRLGIYGRYCYY